MEPYEEEEARQAAWDMKCERAPHCAICGGSVYPYDTYMALPNGDVICEPCSDKLIHGTEDLEDLW